MVAMMMMMSVIVDDVSDAICNVCAHREIF